MVVPKVRTPNNTVESFLVNPNVQHLWKDSGKVLAEEGIAWCLVSDRTAIPLHRKKPNDRETGTTIIKNRGRSKEQK